jgi:two-component system C4-dicarboxylate transport sensor histidine kinase DctB
MRSDSAHLPGGTLPRLPLLFAGLALLVGAAALAFPRIEAFFLRQEAARAEATLRLTVDGLTGAIDRFKPLPALIAERPLLLQVLKDPSNAGLLPYANEQLRQTSFTIGASDVYLMDITGLTLAASSYRKELSFVGRTFGYRPYFTQALDGGVGQFFALGTTSGERGYFIAAPVLDATRIVGVVAVKFSVEDFEQSWRGAGSEIIVRDLNGVIFMASRPDWHFRATEPLDAAARRWIESTRQYPLDRVTPLTLKTTTNGRLTLAEITEPDGSAPAYIQQSDRIAEAGWTVSILAPTAPATTRALWVLAGVALALALAALAVAVYLQRRARLTERFTAQARAQELAEAEVARRTAELNATNLRLQSEVEERRTAEDRLRKTQAELVQAGKLAALGQMSAALSHEINQPLAAVKSYADNAATFLDRDRPEDARSNVKLISDMADRMSAISKHLRNFARRPQEKLGPVPVLAVIDDAVALMSSRLKAEGAALDFDRPNTEIWITGGAVRLQQVVVNLLSNALDAMAGRPAPVITIAIDTDATSTRIRVRDRGPGIAPEILPQIFDPFYSTKGPGSGLGLGLSISYNIIRDFGGTLSAANLSDGAEFSILLRRTDARPAATPEAAE